MTELRRLARDGILSDAIRELIHAQYVARLYAQAAGDAERLRGDQSGAGSRSMPSCTQRCN
jgi:hypothetical protein